MADIAYITLPDGTKYDIKDATARTGLNGKVDNVSGKGLSTNDYTTTEKNKLAGIAAGAEANVQSDWNVTDTSSDAFIKNKPSIPSATSDLTNDSNFVSDAGYVHTDNNFTNALKTKLDNLPTSFPNFYVDPTTMNLIQDGEIQEYEFQLLDGYLIV